MRAILMFVMHSTIMDMLPDLTFYVSFADIVGQGKERAVPHVWVKPPNPMILTLARNTNNANMLIYTPAKLCPSSVLDNPQKPLIYEREHTNPIWTYSTCTKLVNPWSLFLNGSKGPDVNLEYEHACPTKRTPFMLCKCFSITTINSMNAFGCFWLL